MKDTDLHCLLRHGLTRIYTVYNYIISVTSVFSVAKGGK